MKLKTALITCGVCLLPILFGLIIYDCLPAQMPIHWNIAGEIDNYASKEIFVFLLPILMSGIQFGYEISINIVVPIFLGILFVILGNYLPKCRQNFTMGYRLPWTLNDEDNWNKTNRLAGYVMVLGGILIIIMSFFDLAFWAVILFVGAILIIPSVYSFLLYRKK